MAEKDVRVRIGFGAATPFGTTSWTDVSSDVQEIHIRRGRQHELDRMEAGVANIILENSSGNYYPDNSGGDFSPNVKLMKRVDISMADGTATHLLYTGYVESYTPSWRSEAGKAPIMTIECVDILKPLARLLLNDATGYSAEASGTRVSNVLQDLSFPAASRKLDVGVYTLQASGSLGNENSLNHLQKVQESELGLFYQLTGGSVQFEDRSHRSVSPHDTVQVTFGDGAGEEKYVDIELVMDDSLLYNEIRATRIGGDEKTASNSGSQETFGKRVLSRTGLLLNSDTAVADYTTLLVARFGTIEASRAKSITINPDRDAASLYPKILKREISDRIGVKLNQAGLDDEYFIEGTEYDWNIFDDQLRARFMLSDASRYLFPPDEVVVILRPNAAGAEQDFDTVVGGPAHAACGDDSDATDIHEAVYTEGWIQALFNIPDLDFSKGTISEITVVARMKEVKSDDLNVTGTPIIRTGGSVYGGAGAGSITLTTSYVNISQEWTTNPVGGSAWTVAAINALQIGCKSFDQGPINPTFPYLADVWATVTITPGW